MIPNPQYDYDYGPNGPLAALHAREHKPGYPGTIAPPVGWVDLVVDLDARLAEIVPNYVIAQVKEKFGGLRFYVESYGVGWDDPLVRQAFALITEAENASKTMCQVCGGPATLRSHNGWHATLCDEHDD